MLRDLVSRAWPRSGVPAEAPVALTLTLPCPARRCPLPAPPGFCFLLWSSRGPQEGHWAGLSQWGLWGASDPHVLLLLAAMITVRPGHPGAQPSPSEAARHLLQDLFQAWGQGWRGISWCFWGWRGPFRPDQIESRIPLGSSICTCPWPLQSAVCLGRRLPPPAAVWLVSSSAPAPQLWEERQKRWLWVPAALPGPLCPSSLSTHSLLVCMSPLALQLRTGIMASCSRLLGPGRGSVASTSSAPAP